MTLLTRILFMGAVAVLAYACVDQDNDLEPCETEQVLFIVPDWIDTEPLNRYEKVQITIRSDNGDVLNTTSPVDGREIELMSGDYHFVGYESAANVTVSGDVVSLSSGSDGYLHEPGPFSGGTKDTTVYNTVDYQAIPIPMRKQTRDLIIQVNLIGDAVNLVSGAQCVVDGVDASREIDFGFPPADGRERPPSNTSGAAFYTLERQDDTNSYSGRKTLLGINGQDDQDLSLRVFFRDGNHQDITEDIMERTIGFHTRNVNEPWYIILTIEVGVSFDMYIVDWYYGAESWLDAQ